MTAHKCTIQQLRDFIDRAYNSSSLPYFFAASPNEIGNPSGSTATASLSPSPGPRRRRHHKHDTLRLELFVDKIEIVDIEADRARPGVVCTFGSPDAS